MMFNLRIWIVVLLSVWSGSLTTAREQVARSIPLLDMGLDRAPYRSIVTPSKIRCLTQCALYNCSSFNYGSGICELLDTYLCQGPETLTIRPGVQYFDVEVEAMIPVAGVFRNEVGCLTNGICSPKCYMGTTSVPTTSTMTPGTTTNPPPPTTTTTTNPPPPTTTTTTNPPPTTTTTTTNPPTTTTTTNPPTTTTTNPPTTTTTNPPPPTTTTTTNPPTTTTTTNPPTTTTTTNPPTMTTTNPPTTTTTNPPTTTTVSPVPGPGDVNFACISDIDCTAPNSDCRNDVICECIAGYSYNSATKTCDTTCPGDYDATFTETTGFYIYGYDISVQYFVDLATCKTSCIAEPGCVSLQYDELMTDCYLSYVTKAGHEADWYEDAFFRYFQRNCL